jgi:phage recombination protein Bet
MSKEQTNLPARAATAAAPNRSVTVAMAERYGMEAEAFEATLRGTVVPASTTKPEFSAFLLVAKEHKLNPMTREIYAFPKKGGGIQPIVSIDGWARIINEHPTFDGMEFEDERDKDGKIVSVLCKMFRKDRSRPTAIREYLSECIMGTEPWKRWPYRMLRHKSMIQCARMAFGFSGIVDEDEAERLISVGVVSDKVEAPARLQAGFGDETDQNFREAASEAAGATDDASGSEGSADDASSAQTAAEGQDAVEDAEFEVVDPATGEVTAGNEAFDDDLDGSAEDGFDASAGKESDFPGDKKADAADEGTKAASATDLFNAKVEAAATWTEIKAALREFSTSSAWSEMGEDDQRALRVRLWERVVAVRDKGAKDTDPASDPQLFRIFGEIATEEDVLMGTWSTLIRTERYQGLQEAQKDGLKRFVSDRRKAINA